MIKLGKPKGTFDKAVKEIESFIKNPSVRHIFMLYDCHCVNLIRIIAYFGAGL
jgi:hypothetical protein